MKIICHFRALRSSWCYLAMAGMLGLLLAAGSASAACNLVASVARVQMGQMSVSSLRTANVPGYRSMGTKTQLLSATCDVPQAAFRVEFTGLAAVIGKPVLRWGTVGAMQLRVVGASVAGLPVNVKLESAPASAYAQAVDLTQNDVLALDLSQVPAQDRKSLSIQLQVTGLLPENHTVSSELVLDSNVSVQLLGVQ